MELSFKNKFGRKIFKVALDGGFDCPNRDGTVAHGGCTFAQLQEVVTLLVTELIPLKYNSNRLKKECMKNGAKDNTLLTSKPSLTRMRL